MLLERFSVTSGIKCNQGDLVLSGGFSVIWGI